MDMYYRLKEELLCQDCKTDLKFNGILDNNCFSATCIACGAKVEVELEIRQVLLQKKS